MAVRLQQHGQNGLALAQWLSERPEVEKVLHPAMPDDPGHAIWKRDFLGASGLFTVVLTPDLEDGGYVAECPAIPGCVSEGETVEEALANIQEAIEGCLESIAARHETLPEEGVAIVATVDARSPAAVAV